LHLNRALTHGAAKRGAIARIHGLKTTIRQLFYSDKVELVGRKKMDKSWQQKKLAFSEQLINRLLIYSVRQPTEKHIRKPL